MQSAASRQLWVKRCLKKAVSLVLLGVLCAFFYNWGSARFYPQSKPSGFAHGMLHGAMMPMALPSLLLGQDPPIYAESNSGRGYKLGYIAGINLCGLVFFGLAFWSPKQKVR